MISPYQLTSFDTNYLEIGTNLDLANRLVKFFSLKETQSWWNISTDRQRIAIELKDTRMISLRRPVTNNKLQSTMQWNQVTEIVDDDILLNSFPVFKDTYQWLKDTMQSTGASKIEWGRVFFSKHLAGTKIGLHRDEGAYFSHFDRFHFVIDSNSENIFYIRDCPIILETGKVYWVNNHVPHWLENSSPTDRINLIFDVRLS
jgi:hypothetical protein